MIDIAHYSSDRLKRKERPLQGWPIVPKRFEDESLYHLKMLGLGLKRRNAHTQRAIRVEIAFAARAKSSRFSRKSATSAVHCAGASHIARWPRPRRTISCAPGIKSAITSEFRGGIKRSLSPVTTKVGARTPGSAVEESKSTSA